MNENGNQRFAGILSNAPFPKTINKNFLSTKFITENFKKGTFDNITASYRRFSLSIIERKEKNEIMQLDI